MSLEKIVMLYFVQVIDAFNNIHFSLVIATTKCGNPKKFIDLNLFSPVRDGKRMKTSLRP